VENRQAQGELDDLVFLSDIRAMSLECDQVGGVNLSQGVCDLELPVVLEQAVAEAVSLGVNHYTRFDGIPEIRQAISEKSMAYNNVEANVDDNIVVSAGCTGAFYCAAMALLKRGDEVILFEPYYGYHVNTLLAVGAKIRYVPMHPSPCGADWTIDWDALDRAKTDKTRAIMINTPVNPCGKVFSLAELEQIGEFCKQHDLLVFTDEIYEYIVLDGVQHISPASLPVFRDRTITMSGYSKTFSITGWRMGYAICPAKYHERIGFMNDLVYVCAPAPLQWAVAKAIRALPETFYSDMVRVYTRKRDLLCNALSEAGLVPFVPKGAYYVLADVSRIPGDSAKERAMKILEWSGVATVPGSAFYHDQGGDTLVRLCFAKKDAVLEVACERLQTLRHK
jgi:aminotransferase